MPRQNPLYTQDNFNLLGDPAVPNHAIKLFAEQGFGCIYQCSDSLQDVNGAVEVERRYFRAARGLSVAAPFWLQIAFFPGEANIWTWEIAVGDIGGFEGDWEKSVVIGERERRGQFAFKPYSEGNMDMCLTAQSDEGAWLYQVNPSFLALDIQLRERLARGWYWLGVPLEKAIELSGIELTGHQQVEWIEQRKSAVRQLQIWMLLEEVPAARDPMDERQQGRRLYELKQEMERQAGGYRVTANDLSEVTGIDPREIRRLLRDFESSL